MEKKYKFLRSKWEFGEASECRRGLVCGMGYSAEELNRPIIGVVNSWNEYNPGHVHLDKHSFRHKRHAHQHCNIDPERLQYRRGFREEPGVLGLELGQRYCHGHRERH